MANVETIPCPYCKSSAFSSWATEIGFNAVRCSDCRLIYVSPRPSLSLISAAVQSGAHGEEAGGLVVVARRQDAKIARYKKVFSTLFDDVWKDGKPISWLDIGAGYGEIVEAVSALAPEGSRVEGYEPMKPKVEQAQLRGLSVIEGYLDRTHPKVQIASVVDVYSHVPDFDSFLAQVRDVLVPGGQIFIETGNLADLNDRSEFPNELGLPDHLVFAGEAHIRGHLDRAGFDIVRIERQRIDGVVNLAKNAVKIAIGRTGHVGMPYTSNYRQLLVRAQLRTDVAIS